MKTIFIPFVLLLCACSGQNASQNAVATPTPADTAATTPAPEPEIDAASGATSAPNQTSFNGTLVIPPQSHATVTLTMDGTIRSTSLLPGDYVKRGSVVATLENPEFITLQQTYLDSHAQNEFLRAEYLRQEALAREEAASQKRFQQSKADYLSMRSRMDAAAAQLSLLGIDTASLLTAGIVPCLEIKAPISGYAADVQMNIGKHFSSGDPLCEIVDKSNTMLRLTAYEKDLQHLQVGDAVEFRVNGMGKETFHAVVTVIGQQVNNENRSIEAYARVKEQNPQFRPGMYITARVKRK